MVIRLRRQDIPHAGLKVLCRVAVIHHIPLISVVFQTVKVAVNGIQTGYDIDHAVIGKPAAVDIYAARCVFIIVAAHHLCKGLEKYEHVCVGQLGLCDLAVMRCIAGHGEVINIVLYLDAVVYLHCVVDGEVIYRIVVVAHELLVVEYTNKILKVGLAVLLIYAEVLKLEIVHALELGDAEGCADIVHEVCDYIGGNVAFFNEGRAVVGCGHRRERIHPVASAALKERRDLNACRLCGCDLFGCAVCENFKEHTDGCAAEAVTDEVNLLIGAPAVKQRLVISDAEAIVILFAGVDDTVIDPCAGKLGIELARSVPCSGERSDLRSVAFKALAVQILHQITGRHAPVRDYRVKIRSCAPAHKPVDKNKGIIRLRYRVVRRCGECEETYCKCKHYHYAQQPFGFSHAHPPCIYIQVLCVQMDFTMMQRLPSIEPENFGILQKSWW